MGLYFCFEGFDCNPQQSGEFRKPAQEKTLGFAAFNGFVFAVSYHPLALLLKTAMAPRSGGRHPFMLA